MKVTSKSVSERLMAPHSKLDWSRVVRFNFTYAIPGGAWLQWPEQLTSAGMQAYCNWYSFATIQKHLGQAWIDRQLRKQGWMTGCWVDVDGGAQ